MEETNLPPDFDPFEELNRVIAGFRPEASKRLDPPAPPSPPPSPPPVVKEEILNDPEKLTLIRNYFLYKADRARRNVVDFFEFALKEETTRKPIKIAEHQRVILDFAMAHDRAVYMLPVGHGKTFTMGGLSLYLLGQNPTLRGAIISDTQTQAEKPLAMVRDYIETSPELRMVFPNLRKSPRKSDSWTQTEITIDRPPGIRDASLIAVGYHGAISGARLNWIIVDDLLSPENTKTKQARDELYEWFDAAVLSRLDPRNARIIVTNTVWHPDDLVHRLEKLGWPTMRMDILGGIKIQNTDWDTDAIRPESDGSMDCRLSKYDNHTPLFPERFDREAVDRIRRSHLPHRFNQLFMSNCRDNETARCKLEWIEKCKKKGRGLSLRSNYDGPNLTFTGVDLAISENEASHDSCFFTFEVLPTGERLILDIDAGKYDGPTIIDKLFEKHKRYNSYIRVENNACFVEGTLVLTKQGYIPIECVKVGDEVWTHKARWRKVTDTLSGDARMITTANAKGCIPVTVTPNHWFWLREAGRTAGRAGGHYVPVGEAQWVSVGFPNKVAYAAIAIPSWDENEATVTLPKTRLQSEKTIEVDEELALLIGLYLAEGHCTKGQVSWTFHASETFLADLVESACRKLTDRSITRRYGNGTLRVVVSSTQLARLFHTLGKGETKSPPMEWFGWPLPIRLAIFRGWLLGDGCLRYRNLKTVYPSQFFAGDSISRNLILFMRTVLSQSGYKSRLSASNRKTDTIEGRQVNRKTIYTLQIPAQDSYELRQSMTHAAENSRWPCIYHSGRKANASMVFDGEHAWSKLNTVLGGPFHGYKGTVYNLEVEEDHSYTVEDMIVHNAQDFIRQFALERDMSLPIMPHTTGRSKAHPEHGVEGLFIEIFNSAWIIPCDKAGICHPSVQRAIDACLYYNPSKHTDDVLMAWYFGREEAKRFGVLTGSQTATLNLGTTLLSR